MTDRLELTLTLHGLESYNRDVDGEVFARKLTLFLRGIRHSDKAVNSGVRRHKLLLTELSKNTATAGVREQVFKRGAPSRSGMAFYARAIDAVYSKRPEATALPLPLLRDIASLNTGVGHSFEFGVFKSNQGALIRIDDYLERTSRALIQEVAAGAKGERPSRFKGVAHGTFDGKLRLIDLLGDVRKAILILTAGGRQIECIVNALTVAQLKDALDSRVLVYGRAHYDGTSGLPVRLDVTDAKPVEPKPNLSLARWRGTFALPEEGHAEDWD